MPAPGKPRVAVTRHLPRGLSLLLVEDDMSLARVMTHWAAWLGATMDTAGTAGAALRLAAAKTYAVMLLDLSLPDMDAAAAYPRLVELQPKLASRTIILTGGAVNPAGQAFLSRTPCTIVLKPFELDVLAERILALDPAAA